MSFLFYSISHNNTLVLLTFVVLVSDTCVSSHIIDSLCVESDSFYWAEQVIMSSGVTLITMYYDVSSVWKD